MKINESLGYDMNSVEFAIRDGIPYAIDFTNPAPDMHVDSILPQYFEICVDWMVDFCVKTAKGQRGTRDDYRWAKMIDPKIPLLGPLGGDR
jgi:hypothetical protein